jgi:hypothetical protein
LLCWLQKFGMTDHATFGVSFESHDLFVPAVDKKAPAPKKVVDADDSSSNKPGHVLKSLLPAGRGLGGGAGAGASGIECL